MTPTTRKHIAAIQSGAVTRCNIIGISKALRAEERQSRGYSTGATAPRVSADDITAIFNAIDASRPLVTGELHASGVAMLQSKRNAKRLAPIADIVADIAYFRLLDYRDNWPVYGAYTSNGSYVTFQNIPWQSGGDGPDIIAIHRNAA